MEKQKASKINPLENALKCVRLSDAQDFEKTFCRVTGYLDVEEYRNPDALCRVGDVREIFDCLFKMRFGKTETPGAATPRESK